MQQSAGVNAGRGEVQSPARARRLTALIHAAFACCFAAACFTNDVILALVRDVSGRGADWPRAASRVMFDATGDYYEQFWLGSLKSTAFMAAMIVFAYLLRGPARQLWPLLKDRPRWINVGCGLLIASIFLFAVVPNGMGRIYGYISVDPFLQPQGFYHRRILMPALAHHLQLGGVMYGVFCWIVTLVTLALTSLYLESRGLVLSRLELASLYTSGIFASALAMPGYPEIMVLCLTLIALLDFDSHRASGNTQLICFGLALLTHESAAVLAFGTLALFYFDRKAIVPLATLLALYLLIWLASNGFNLSRAAALQLTGGVSNFEQFQRNIPRVLFSLLAAYKLVLAAGFFTAAVHLGARRYRPALAILAGLGGSVALTAIATDYTRMMAFGSFAILLALPLALAGLSPRLRLALTLVNLAIPTVYVAAHDGAFAYGGLYGAVLTHFFGFRS